MPFKVPNTRIFKCYFNLPEMKTYNWFTDPFATVIFAICHVFLKYSYFEKGCRKKKHQSACDKTEMWSGYSLEFCILA